MSRWEQSVNKQYFDFEVMCRNKTDAARKALLEAEVSFKFFLSRGSTEKLFQHWERQRTKLSRPICNIDKNIKKIRAEITERENRFERLRLVTQDLLLRLHRPKTTDSRRDSQ